MAPPVSYQGRLISSGPKPKARRFQWLAGISLEVISRRWYQAVKDAYAGVKNFLSGKVASLSNLEEDPSDEDYRKVVEHLAEIL